MDNKKKAALCILCVTVILACFCQAFPKYRELRKYSAATESSAVSITPAQSTPDEIVTMSSPDEAQEPAEDYKTTEEYRITADRISAIQERIRLLNNGITSDLTDITKQVFDEIGKISDNPTDAQLRRNCMEYMTDDFFERFKSMTFKKGTYMLYNIKFSDLDKNDITAYIITRSEKRFIVTYTFDKVKNYVISDIIEIRSED